VKNTKSWSINRTTEHETIREDIEQTCWNQTLYASERLQRGTPGQEIKGLAEVRKTLEEGERRVVNIGEMKQYHYLVLKRLKKRTRSPQI